MRIAIVGSGPLAVALHNATITAGHTVSTDDASQLDALIFAPWEPSVAQPCALADLTDAAFEAAWQTTMDHATAACIRGRLLSYGTSTI